MILNIDKAAADYVDIWVEETLSGVEGMNFNYSAAMMNDFMMCEHEDHLTSIAVFQVTAYVTFDDFPENEVIRFTTGIPISHIIDADMEPIQKMLDELWEQITLIHLTGGAKFEVDMEAIAREHGE